MIIGLTRAMAKKLSYETRINIIKMLIDGEEKEAILDLAKEFYKGHHLHKNPTKEKKPAKEKRPKLVGDSYFVGVGRAVE
jgi:hypothetical protein